VPVSAAPKYTPHSIKAVLTCFFPGKWQFPGGHLEMGESYFACAERETFEETGLRVHAERVIAITNDVFDPASKHYVTIFVLCTREDDTQEPMVSDVLSTFSFFLLLFL